MTLYTSIDSRSLIKSMNDNMRCFKNLTLAFKDDVKEISLSILLHQYFARLVNLLKFYASSQVLKTSFIVCSRFSCAVSI